MVRVLGYLHRRDRRNPIHSRVGTTSAARRYVVLTTKSKLVQDLRRAFASRANLEMAPFWGSHVWGKCHKNGAVYSYGTDNAMHVPTPSRAACTNTARANARKGGGSSSDRVGRTGGGRASAHGGTDSGCGSRSGSDSSSLAVEITALPEQPSAATAVRLYLG